MFVVNAETVIQLEADPQAVIDTLVVAAIQKKDRSILLRLSIF